VHAFAHQKLEKGENAGLTIVNKALGGVEPAVSNSFLPVDLFPLFYLMEIEWIARGQQIVEEHSKRIDIAL
jgi:hypothetical protein